MNSHALLGDLGTKLAHADGKKEQASVPFATLTVGKQLPWQQLPGRAQASPEKASQGAPGVLRGEGPGPLALLGADWRLGRGGRHPRRAAAP